MTGIANPLSGPRSCNCDTTAIQGWRNYFLYYTLTQQCRRFRHWSTASVIIVAETQVYVKASSLVGYQATALGAHGLKK